MCWLQCSAFSCVSTGGPGVHTPTDEYEWSVRAHSQTSARSFPVPPSTGTSVSAVTQCYPRQPGKRLWRSNQLWLNTEYHSSHYSKSRTAVAPTTIDYPNITRAEAPLPTFAVFLSGGRTWLVLLWFIDIAFHLRWPPQYFSGNVTELVYSQFPFSLKLFSCLRFLFGILCTKPGLSDYTCSALLRLYCCFQGSICTNYEALPHRTRRYICVYCTHAVLIGQHYRVSTMEKWICMKSQPQSRSPVNSVEWIVPSFHCC